MTVVYSRYRYQQHHPSCSREEGNSDCRLGFDGQGRKHIRVVRAASASARDERRKTAESGTLDSEPMIILTPPAIPSSSDGFLDERVCSEGKEKTQHDTTRQDTAPVIAASAGIGIMMLARLP